MGEQRKVTSKRKRDEQESYSGASNQYFRSISFWASEPEPKPDMMDLTGQSPGPATEWTEQDSARAEVARQERILAQGDSQISQEELLEKLPFDMLEETMGILAAAEVIEAEEDRAAAAQARSTASFTNRHNDVYIDDGFVPSTSYLR